VIDRIALLFVFSFIFDGEIKKGYYYYDYWEKEASGSYLICFL
jgi:hypothetical protein